MGLGQACRRKAESNGQLEQRAARLQRVGIGAKSLDRDLGDVHTWPHSHYLKRRYNGVDGWEKVRLRYKLCRYGCEINDLMKEETGNSVPYIRVNNPTIAPDPTRPSQPPDMIPPPRRFRHLGTSGLDSLSRGSSPNPEWL